MKVKIIIATCLMAFMGFMFYSCGGGGSSTPVTKSVKGAAMKDFMIGAKVSIYDATGAKVDDGNCVTGDYGVFDCAVSNTATAPYTVIIAGGKLDKDGKSSTATDQADASKVTLATVVPTDTTPTVASPVTTAILMDEAGVTDPKNLDNGTQAKSLAGKKDVVESRFKAFSGMVYVDPDKASELSSAESNVAEIVKAYDSKNFDNTTGVYTGDVSAIVDKLAQDMSDGALDGKKDGEALKDTDNKTVVIPDNVTKGEPKVYATSVTIGGVTDDNLTDGLNIENADSLDKTFKVTVTSSNADGTYTIVPEFYAKDKNGSREITATLNGATVTVDNGSISAKVAKDATVTITGKDSSGNDVNATLTNLAEDTLTAANGVLTYDLSKVESKLAGTNTALKEVFVEGASYDVKLSIPGLPQFLPIVGTVTVGTPECGTGSYLKYCDETNCSSVGKGFWYNDKCNAEAECKLDNLTACNTEAKCTGIGKYWYDNKCNADQQTQPAATATVTKTGDVTGTAGGAIGFKASVALPDGVTCGDNCSYTWDLDSNGKVDGVVGAATVTAYYGSEASGTATVYVVNSSGQCIAKGTYAYDLAGDALGGTPPQALDLVSLVEGSTVDVPSCQ